ncbi:hypothetical protein Hanom_Chr15g01406731 [Helianthus anomalus]
MPPTSDFRMLFMWASKPAADSIFDKLYDLGYMDAALSNPVEELIRENNPTFKS